MISNEGMKKEAESRASVIAFIEGVSHLLSQALILMVWTTSILATKRSSFDPLAERHQ